MVLFDDDVFEVKDKKKVQEKMKKSSVEKVSEKEGKKGQKKKAKKNKQQGGNLPLYLFAPNEEIIRKSRCCLKKQILFSSSVTKGGKSSKGGRDKEGVIKVSKKAKAKGFLRVPVESGTFEARLNAVNLLERFLLNLF